MTANANTKPIPVLNLVEIAKGEVGETIHVETPQGCFNATWLGTVSNGKELAEAMRLMADIERERQGIGE